MTGEGIAPKKIKRLDNACDRWRELIAQRQAVLEEEVKARDKVVAIMHEEGIVCYPYFVDDDTRKLLILDSTEKLKLKKAEETGSEPSDTDVNDD